MKKSFPTRQLIQSAICVLLLLAAVLFFVRAGQPIARSVVLLAIVLLITGFIGLMGASSQTAGAHMPEWPLIQGLLDVMMGIMLLMSYQTRLSALLLFLLVIWALMGAAARVFSAVKLKVLRYGRVFFQILLMILGALLFLLGALVDALDPAVAIGLGLVFCAVSSLHFPLRAKPKS